MASIIKINKYWIYSSRAASCILLLYYNFQDNFFDKRGFKADIFSIGCVFHEFLFEMTLFKGSSKDEIL